MPVKESDEKDLSLVVDTNILFSAVVSRGKTFEALRAGASSETVSFVSPEFAIEELEFHKNELLKRFRKDNLSERDLNAFIESFKVLIEFVPMKKYVPCMEEAMHLIPDSDDIDFAALSLSKGKIPIWSQDEHFSMQPEIKVFKTSELIEEMERRGMFS